MGEVGETEVEWAMTGTERWIIVRSRKVLGEDAEVQ